MALWMIVQKCVFRMLPKPFGRTRINLLRAFGAKITGTPYIASSARIRFPWNLTVRPQACLGEHSECYNLGPIEIGERATISQHVYLCSGTHDLSDPRLPLMTGKITVGADSFVGVRALILPGVTLGNGCVVGAGSVVTRDVEPWDIVAGNPAKFIKKREMRPPTEGS